MGKIKREGCVVSGCDRPHEARGFCRVHYRPAAKAVKAGAGSWEHLAEHPEEITAGSGIGGNGDRPVPEPAADQVRIENPIPVRISLLRPESFFILAGRTGRLNYVNQCCASVEIRNGRFDRYGREDRRYTMISTETEVLAEASAVGSQLKAMPLTPPGQLTGDARRLYKGIMRNLKKMNS